MQRSQDSSRRKQIRHAALLALLLSSSSCFAQADAFEQFMNNLGRLFSLPALSPEALHDTAGLTFSLAERLERFLPRYSRTVTYSLVQAFPGIGESGSRLVVQSEGMPVQKESQTLHLFIPSRVWPTCVAESDLLAKFGAPVGRVTPRPSPHARAPTGAPRLFVSYLTPHGLNITFVYVNECASGVNITSATE
jgi:hypothetical protein